MPTRGESVTRFHRLYAIGSLKWKSNVREIANSHVKSLASARFCVDHFDDTNNPFGPLRITRLMNAMMVRMMVKLLPLAVEAWRDGRVMAQHERCYDRNRSLYELEHYLDVLERKPGALAGSTPLAQWRAKGRWPASYCVGSA